MKQKMIAFMSFVFGLILFSNCSRPDTAAKEENSYVSVVADNLEDYPVRVLSFHTSNRCQTCLTIEKIVRETVLTEYKEQVEDGTLKLYVMNVEQAENQKIAEEYVAYGSALFVSSGVGELTEISDLTNNAFMYAGTNADKFIEILRSTLNQHLE
ncbi:MAG: hypothetical protein IH597_08635 [Bacteroidales bacterium]|nr:hypothetical protein [Bacteroidales bacterium]